MVEALVGGSGLCGPTTEVGRGSDVFGAVGLSRRAPLGAAECGRCSVEAASGAAEIVVYRVRSGPSAAENASEVASERMDPDGLLRQPRRVVHIQLTSALRVTEIDPVGRLVAGTAEARRLHEGLQQNRTVAVALLPVIDKPAAGHGQQHRGEIGRPDPRQGGHILLTKFGSSEFTIRFILTTETSWRSFALTKIEWSM